MEFDFPVFGSNAGDLWTKAMAVLNEAAPGYRIDRMDLDVEPVGVMMDGRIIGWRGRVKAVVSL